MEKYLQASQFVGGDRANTIHYVKNDRPVHEGELVLMDAGCELHGYTSDVTRTWPVSGRFSAPQRELYEALLDVQETLLRAHTHRGTTLNVIYLTMLDLLATRLTEVGLIDNSASREEAKAVSAPNILYCPLPSIS